MGPATIHRPPLNRSNASLLVRLHEGNTSVICVVGLEELLLAVLQQVLVQGRGLLGLALVEGPKWWLLGLQARGLVYVVLRGEAGDHVQDFFVVAGPWLDVALHLLLQERLLDRGVEGAGLCCLQKLLRLLLQQLVACREELLVVEVR